MYKYKLNPKLGEGGYWKLASKKQIEEDLKLNPKIKKLKNFKDMVLICGGSRVGICGGPQKFPRLLRVLFSDLIKLNKEELKLANGY